MSMFANISLALAASGWSIEKVELASDCWWAKELWKLHSDWSPKGATIYLSLLVDPSLEIDENNVPDTSVWAVGLSSAPPKDRLDPEVEEIALKHRMKDAISEILVEADRLRLAP